MYVLSLIVTIIKLTGQLYEFSVFVFSEFSGFGHCIRSLWQRCPTVQQVTDKHWRPIVELITSACNLTDVKYGETLVHYVIVDKIPTCFFHNYWRHLCDIVETFVWPKVRLFLCISAPDVYF